jgi:gliding motility-associated-like protein
VNITPDSRDAIWNYGDKPFEQKGDSTFYCYDKAGNFNLRLTVTDVNNCKASYTYSNAVQVLLKPQAGFVTDPGTITLNDAENVLIKNTTSNASSYNWYIDGVYFGSKKDITYWFKDTGCYDIRLLTQNANGCKDSTIRSICVFEGFNFYMPSAFTPNNDGLNDVFLPKGTGWLFDNYKLEVYNRWGQKVFSTSNVYEGWDGGFKMDPFNLDATRAKPNDIYTWRAVVTDNLQKQHVLSGMVSLVR